MNTTELKKHGFKLRRIDPKFDGTIESLQAYIAELSNVVRDKEIKNDANLWNRLLKEAVGNTASSVFRFIPCKLHGDKYNESYKPQLFGFKLDADNKVGYNYYTNARELLNWGWSLEQVLEVVDFTDYVAFRAVAPFKVYSHLRTHCVPMWLSHSARYTLSRNGYWYPDEFIEWWGEGSNFSSHQKQWNYIVENKSPIELRKFMINELGIGSFHKKIEINSLGADMLAKRAFSFGGYLSNKNDIPHLIAQRTDRGTMTMTKNFVKMIRDLIITDEFKSKNIPTKDNK